MIQLPAPAKINLFLHVIGRRPDGFHELQTVFQFLDFADQLSFDVRDDAEIKLEGDHCGVSPEQNLVYKAAKRLQAFSGCQQGATITINKYLPSGAGIGGGSSDAATTLMGLNHLWRCHLSEGQLADIGAALGADVPVFVRGRSAFAEGIGERLQPLDLPEPAYLLLKPATNISTAEIFSHEELTRTTSPIKIAAFLSGATRTRNDCLPIVEKLYPEIGDARAWLNQYGAAKLTGTGACLFAEIESDSLADQALQDAPAKWQLIKARAMNRSSAHIALADIIDRKNG